MNINGKEVKAIRPMTKDEIKEYSNVSEWMTIGNTIWCIELIDGSILLPRQNCINCMLHQDCLFSLIPYMP